MTPSSSPFDAALLDRLVDGELGPDEYRQALALVESEPDGWRRLALAFLEAQAWRGELTLAAAAAPANIAKVCAEPVRPTSASPDQPWLAWAAALSLLVVVGGSALFWSGGTPGSLGPPAGPPSERSSAPTAALGLLQPVLPRAAPDRVKVTVAQENERTEFEVPVVEAHSLAAARAAMNRSAISPEADQALEQAGVTVLRQQQYLSIELDDGRRMVVPVEQVELVPRDTQVAWQ